MNRNLLATILIIVAVGIYFTATENVINQGKAIKAINDRYDQAITSASKLISVRDQVLNDFNNISQDDKDRLSKILPNSVDNIRMIIDMNNMAFQHNLILTGLAVSAANSAKPAPKPAASMGANAGMGFVDNSNVIVEPTLDTVTINFGVSASYDKFQTFLQDLETNLRVMDVTHLTVTANDSGTYDWSVGLTTYWLRQP